MATFVLIHGAGDVGWYWHLVEAELHARGHDVVAPDLPCDDDSAGLVEYADAVVAAVEHARTEAEPPGPSPDLVVVAQSFGGFTAPLVCERLPVRLLVLVAAMIPAPGEVPAEHTENTRYADDAWDGYGDETDVFYPDVPRALALEAQRRAPRQSEARMGEPSPLRAWPDVPTRVILCRDDRVLTARYLRRVARERLGITPDEIDGGHTPALSRPVELTDRLVAYAAEQGLAGAGPGAGPRAGRA